MTAGTNRPAIIGALDAIAQWRAQEEEARLRSLREVEQEEEAARLAIEEAQRRITALGKLRLELDEKQTRTVGEADRRERLALREGLAADMASLTARGEIARAAAEARAAELDERMKEPEMAELLAEFESFDEAALAALPPSYRKAITAHHEATRARLQPVVDAMNAGPARLEVDPAAVCVLFATDPPEGPPEALVAVLPVPFAVYRDWADRPEDLSALLAYRVVAAISRVLMAVEAASAPVQCLEVHGCLAIQVWLGDVEVKGELRERMLEEIEALREAAAELSAARLELYGLWVRPALLVDEDSE